MMRTTARTGPPKLPWPGWGLEASPPHRPLPEWGCGQNLSHFYLCRQKLVAGGDDYLSGVDRTIQRQLRQGFIGDEADTEIRTFDLLEYISTFLIGA